MTMKDGEEMTLRDYFAAAAMEGLLSNNNLISKQDFLDMSNGYTGFDAMRDRIVTAASVIADGMIAERSK